MSPHVFDLVFIRHTQQASGAYPASPTFSQYPHSWLRDGSFTAYAMDVWGNHSSARAFHFWVERSLGPYLGHIEKLISHHRSGESIAPTQMLPARFSIEGEWLQDGWPNFQLDGYGQWLWALVQHLELSGETEFPEFFAPTARAVARYLEAFYSVPCSDCWEEKPEQIHTATLASIYGGLKAITKYFPEFAEPAERVRSWILTEFVREDRFVKSNQDRQVDSSLIWVCTPFEVVLPSDPRMRATVNEIKRTLLRDGGLLRYAKDEYYGAGAWLLLSDFLAWHLVRDDQPEPAKTLHSWVESQRQANGWLPEQVAVSSTDPALLESWTQRWGTSASPLLWSHAMHLIAAHALSVSTISSSNRHGTKEL